MEIMKGIAFVAILLASGWWVFGDKWLVKETERNEIHEAPSDQQLRWDIRHMREDLHALVLINYGLAMVVLATLLLKG